jgi:hypothetical protein
MNNEMQTQETLVSLLKRDVMKKMARNFKKILFSNWEVHFFPKYYRFSQSRGITNSEIRELLFLLENDQIVDNFTEPKDFESLIKDLKEW